jgi:hypothetical protein
MIRAKRATRAGWGVLAAAALIGCQGEPEAKKPPQPSFNPQALAVEARAQDIAAGIERYKIDVGQYPETLDDLAQMPKAGRVPTSVPDLPRRRRDRPTTPKAC